MRLFSVPRLLVLLFFLCLLIDSPAHLKHLDKVAFDLAGISHVCIPPPVRSCCSDCRDAQMSGGELSVPVLYSIIKEQWS